MDTKCVCLHDNACFIVTVKFFGAENARECFMPLPAHQQITILTYIDITNSFQVQKYYFFQFVQTQFSFRFGAFSKSERNGELNGKINKSCVSCCRKYLR